MTHRERILAALSHSQPDRLPVDLGSTIATTLTLGAHSRLRAHLGMPAGSPPAFFSRRSGTVIPEEAVLERFDIDARPLLLGGPDRFPEREIAGNALFDEWGVTWSKPEGGHYINTDGPFHRLDEPAIPDLDQFQWPDPADEGRFRGLRERAQALHRNTDCAVILNLGIGPVHQAQFMRGFGEWLTDLLACPAFAEALLDRIAAIQAEIASHALAASGDFIDIVMYGDDIASQRSILMHPNVYRELIKPRHRQINDAIKRHGKPILYHSCGSVRALLPDLIETGVDALNPVQVSAAGMDTERLKQEFGRDLTFWGGIDSQRCLPLGTPANVRDEVARRIRDLADGGGYVLAAVHNIQQDVPPENVVAMYDAALAFR